MLDLISILTFCWRVLEILLGVGFIIFVHELGHFAVAKLCGVKCEKFYLGFDFGGLKLCKFHWGETEYGIGIFPLGGYVKMLGQEDNPAKLKEEIERAKLQQSDTDATATSLTQDPSPKTQDPSSDVDLVHAEQALFDPRSYLAKSVPKRMAIISAGVIMNVIFAFLMAALVYGMGVDQIVNVVGKVSGGAAAWRADLRPGDKILDIDGRKITRFDDILKSIPFTEAKQGVSMTIQRPGQEKPITKTVYPDRDGKMPMIGVLSSLKPVLFRLDNGDTRLQTGSAALKVADQLHGGDRVVMIGGEKIENMDQIEAWMVNHPDKPMQMTLESTLPAEKDRPESVKLSVVTMPPQPMRTLGLVMEMGEITAVQEESPAKEAGIQTGDIITDIDGKPIGELGDPMRFPQLMRRRTGEKVDLKLKREKTAEPISVSVKLRGIDWEDPYLNDNTPVTIPQLGIAYRVTNRVAKVESGSPAEKAGIVPGAIIESATIIPPKGKTPHPNALSQVETTFELSKTTSWPKFFYDLQIVDHESDIQLKLQDKKDNKTATGKPISLRVVDAVDWFNSDRGLKFEPVIFFLQAGTFSEALRLGASETWDSLTVVVKILRAMGTQRISPTNLGGPGTIVVYAYRAAERGFPTLLLFLTMLSANLAVLNVLPIPMLDGGHLVFLTYEGIRGKPASERIQIGLSIIGLILLLGLMIFVCGLDIQRFITWLFGK